MALACSAEHCAEKEGAELCITEGNSNYYNTERDTVHHACSLS